MINQNTCNIVIVCYPCRAGGKFLMNSIGLHDDCILQERRYLDFGYQDKINYFKTSLKESQKTKIWNDLLLGCNQLFGIDNSCYVQEYHDIILKKLDPAIHSVSNSSKYFFIAANSTISAQAYLKFWKNAKIVFFENYRNFIKSRCISSKPTSIPGLNLYWNDIKGPDWPGDPPKSMQEFYQLPEYIQSELRGIFDGKIFNWIESYDDIFDLNFDSGSNYLRNQLDPRRYRVWDCGQNYSGAEKFVIEIGKIYDWLNLKIVDTEDLTWFFNEWIKTIKICNYKNT